LTKSRSADIRSERNCAHLELKEQHTCLKDLRITYANTATAQFANMNYISMI